jgi:hypothetical protein
LVSIVELGLGESGQMKDGWNRFLIGLEALKARVEFLVGLKRALRGEGMRGDEKDGFFL